LRALSSLAELRLLVAAPFDDEAVPSATGLPHLFNSIASPKLKSVYAEVLDVSFSLVVLLIDWSPVASVFRQWDQHLGIGTVQIVLCANCYDPAFFTVFQSTFLVYCQGTKVEVNNTFVRHTAAR
jgi:hypothetical protein